jgi:hypothetical protein
VLFQEIASVDNTVLFHMHLTKKSRRDEPHGSRILGFTNLWTERLGFSALQEFISQNSHRNVQTEYLFVDIVSHIEF